MGEPSSQGQLRRESSAGLPGIAFLRVVFRGTCGKVMLAKGICVAPRPTTGPAGGLGGAPLAPLLTCLRGKLSRSCSRRGGSHRCT